MALVRVETKSPLNPEPTVARQFSSLLALLFLCLLPTVEAVAGANSELVPGSRIVFPYYDLRPGFTTFLIFTNIGLASTSIHLEFYDVTCIRRDSTLTLSGNDISIVELAGLLGGAPSGTFRQGFVDAVTGDDVLMGTAAIVNMVEDWAILYPGATARRQQGGPTPFEPYPSRLFLPGFLTPGSLGGVGFTDGLLVLAAPHPTRPGAELPEQPIQVGVNLFFKGGRSDSAGLAGHHVIVPIGQLVGRSRPPTLGWLDLTNNALDESGNPIGLVGLYLQTVSGPGIGMGMAIRLWGAPAEAPAP